MLFTPHHKRSRSRDGASKVRKPRHVVALYAALFSFLINGFLPFYAHANVDNAAVASLVASGVSTEEMTALMGEKILICTPRGFRWVGWDELLSGVGAAGDAGVPLASMACTLCHVSVASLHAALPSFAPVMMHQSIAVAHGVFELPSVAHVVNVARSMPPSRAPPARFWA